MDKHDRFRLSLKFWGVRGSVPTPQFENLGYGGNTSCLEVRLPNNEVVVFDAGTGARCLGLSLQEEFKNQKICATFFLSHYHWDHIQGIPFFSPLYGEGNTFNFYCYESALPDPRMESGMRPAGVGEMLEGQTKMPYFPVHLGALPSVRRYFEIGHEPICRGPMRVYPFPVHHPQGARGYRIESEGAVIVYVPDMEHGDLPLERTLREYSQNADLLILDSQFTPEEYPHHVGWGHTTWLEDTKVARDAKAKQLVLFHHDPTHTDQMMLEIVDRARREFENTTVAQEGAVYVL